jgi:hypothetical protein
MIDCDEVFGSGSENEVDFCGCHVVWLERSKHRLACHRGGLLLEMLDYSELRPKQRFDAAGIRH